MATYGAIVANQIELASKKFFLFDICVNFNTLMYMRKVEIQIIAFLVLRLSRKY